MGRARHLIGRNVERACRRGGLAIVFHTRVGVKFFNSLLRAIPLDYAAHRAAHMDGATSDLSLGFDALKDPWTLVHTPLAESPHVGLMQALLADDPIEATDYVTRARMGTLDSRRPVHVSKDFLGSLRQRFQESADRIAAGEKPLVKVASLGNRTYVVDGKHRAALALALGADVRCEDASLLFYDSYYAWLERRMLERPDDYSRQLGLLALARETLGAPPAELP